MSHYYQQQQEAPTVFSAFSSMKDLSPAVQNHLVRTYNALGMAVLSAAAGVYVNMNYLYWNTVGFVSVLVGFGLIWMLKTTAPTPENLATRTMYLLGFGFLQGLNVSPLIMTVFAYYRDPSALILNAVVCTALVFASFSLTALTSQRRSWLYLGGFLMSALSTMMWMGFFSAVFGIGRQAMFNVELYGGLLLFAGFIIFDTQMIVEKAELGDFDHLGHAVELFTDLVSTFVRILIVLMRNQESRDKKKRSRRED